MSLTAKQLYDGFQAAKAGKRAIGDPALPQLKDESHETRVGWDHVAWLANGSKDEAPIVKPIEPHKDVKAVGVNLPETHEVHPKTGEVKVKK